MRTIIASIFGKENEEQKVLIEFEHIEHRRFFEESWVEVNYIKVVNLITIPATDLDLDLSMAIGEELDYNPNYVRIECEIELPNVKAEKKLKLEKLFV